MEIGKHGPSASDIRDMRNNEASRSEANSTCISDKTRHEIEMQMDGSKLSCSSDHAFAALKNWRDMRDADAIHAMHSSSSRDPATTPTNI